VANDQVGRTWWRVCATTTGFVAVCAADPDFEYIEEHIIRLG
jgi:hypothetical protein